MSLRVGNNQMAREAIRNLNRIWEELARSVERLSTGKRINRVSDDPAGWAAAQSMKSGGRVVDTRG